MRSLIIVILILLCSSGVGSAADYYVAESLGGTGDGSSYVNRMSVASHNAGSFSPGDVIYLVDTISSQVVLPSNGTLGNRITYRGDYSGHAGVLTAYSSMGAIKKDWGHDITIESIEIRNGQIGISMNNEITNVTIRNNTIHDMLTKGILISSDTTPRVVSDNIIIGGSEGNGNTVYNCGVNSGGTDISIARATNVLLSYNKCYGGETDTGIDGIALTHCNDSLIEYNELFNHIKSDYAPSGEYGEDGLDLKGCSNITVQYNHAYGNGVNGLAMNNADADYRECENITFRFNSVHDNKNSNIVISGLVSDAFVHNNLIYNTTTQHGISASDGDNIHIYGNTLINNDGSADDRFQITCASTTSNVTIKNNIIYSYGHNDLMYITALGTITLDNNRYYYTSGDIRFYWYGSYVSFATLQGSPHNQELNGTEGDPLLTSISTQDFTLTASSPCIDNGADLGATYDDGLANTTNFSTFPPTINLLDQDSYGTAWEIGAYVYGAASESSGTVSNVSGLWHFWDYENIPELHAEVNDESVLGYSDGIYTFYEPFYQNKTTDTFYFNETVHLKSNVDSNPGYFKWAGTNTINNSNVTGWNTTSNAAATTQDSTIAFMYGENTASGDITNSTFSNLGYSSWNKYGVFLDSYSGVTIHNNTFTNNLDGLLMSLSDGNTITNNTIYSNTHGLHFSTCDNNDISNNTIYSNSKHGIRLFTSSNNTLTDNNVSDTSGGYYDYSFESNAENNTVSITKASEYFSVDNTIDLINTTDCTIGYDATATVLQDNAATGTQDVNITVTSGTVDYLTVFSGITPSTWYSLFNAADTKIESHVSDSLGIITFATDLTAGTYYVNQSSEVSDSTDPTYSGVSHSTRESSTPCTFSITCADLISLNTKGQYIFATNNSGSWVNESAVNFTSTPQSIETVKTLAASGIVGYRWYITDNAGNENVTPIYSFQTVTTKYVHITALTPGTALTVTTDMTGASWSDTSVTTWDYDMGVDLFTGVGGLIVLAVIMVIIGSVLVGLRGDMEIDKLVGITVGILILVVVFPAIVMTGAQMEEYSGTSDADTSSATLTITDVPTPGQTFTINSETFTLTDGTAAAYLVDIGSNPNTTYVASQIVDSINTYSSIVSAT